MIRLVVKGTAELAIGACVIRNISARFVSCSKETSVLVTDDYFHDKVAKWFNEEPKNAPYPSGTLLWYANEKQTSDS